MSEERPYTVIDGIKCYNPEEANRYADYPDDGFNLTARLEQESFWVRSRNRLLRNIVGQYTRQFNKASFLEIGVGTGAFIREITENKNLKITGSDVYFKGLFFAKKKLPNVEFIQFDAKKGRLETKFDIVGAFDVLEHIDDDMAVISNIYQMLSDGGYFIATVPQYKFLWSRIDDIVKHKRRYSKKELLCKLQEQGFTIDYCSSFLFVLFPLMLISRIFDRSGKIDERSAGIEFESRVSFPKALGWIFDKFMRIDEFLIGRHICLPFGGSILVIAKKVKPNPW